MSDHYLDATQRVEKHKNHLPHWQQTCRWQFVTWHLGDAISVPARRALILEKAQWLKRHPRPWTGLIEKEYYQLFEGRIQKWLDAGIGDCLLRKSSTRDILEKSLFHGDGEQYLLDAFVIMPNHVHTLFMPLNANRLEKIMQGIKSSSSHQINRKLNRKGTLWMEDYWDRMIRNQSHHLRVRKYIQQNPIKAKLSDHEYTLWVRDFWDWTGGAPAPITSQPYIPT